MNSLILQVFCAIFSGILQGASIANEIFLFGSPFLALFCLTPLYVAFYKCKSFKRAFFLFLIQITCVHLISSFWLANFKDFAIGTLGGSALGEALTGGLCGAVFFIFPSRLKNKSQLEKSCGKDTFLSFKRMFYFSACWVLWEWCKSTGYLAYPWGTLSMAAYKWKIITQLASITGVWGISFIFALASSFFGECIFYLEDRAICQNTRILKSNLYQCGIFTFSLFAFTALFGTFTYFIPRQAQKKFNAILVQPNVSSWDDFGDSDRVKISKSLTEAKMEEARRSHKKVDLIVWSEGMLGGRFPREAKTYNSDRAGSNVGSMVKSMQTPLLAGATSILNKKESRYGNAAVLFDKEGMYSGFYNKIHMVPFAEQLPFWNNDTARLLYKKVGLFSWTPGRQYTLFQIPVMSSSYYKNEEYYKNQREHGFEEETPLEYGLKPYYRITLDKSARKIDSNIKPYVQDLRKNPYTTLTFSSPICFEDAFPDVCSKLYNAGSEVFINLTNDSWSETKSAEYQHFIAASYLAIEFRTTLVRCTQSGYTVVVDPAGKIIADLPLFTRDALLTEIPVYKRKATIYSVYGDWLAYCFIAYFMLYLLSVVYTLYLKGKKLPHFIITLRIEKITPYVENEDYKKAALTEEKVKSLPKVKEVRVKNKVASKPALSKTKTPLKAKSKAPEKKNASSSSKKTQTKKSDVKKTVSKAKPRGKK